MPPLDQRVLDRITAAAKKRRRKMLAAAIRALREAADLEKRQGRLLAISDEEWAAAQARDDERARKRSES